MSRIGRAVFIDHKIGIAVVGNDLWHHSHVSSATSIKDFSRLSTTSAALNRRREYSGMPYHVGIGVIQTNKIGLLLTNIGNNGICNFRSTHFRLQIISGYFGRRNKNAFLPGEGFLPTTVEEESNVRVLLRLRNPGLCFACLRQYLAEGLRKIFLCK